MTSSIKLIQNSNCYTNRSILCLCDTQTSGGWSIFTACPWLHIRGDNNSRFHCRIMVGLGGEIQAIHIKKLITFDIKPDKDKFYIKIIVFDKI